MVKLNHISKLMLLLTLVSVLALTGCGRVEKPVIGGEGELALKIAGDADISPVYHTPVESWRASHMNVISSGKVTQESCLACHYEPDNFCNKCHKYVGAQNVFEGKNGKQVLGLVTEEGMEKPNDHTPLDMWRLSHDNDIITAKSSLEECLGCHYEPDNFCNKCHVGAGIRKISGN